MKNQLKNIPKYIRSLNGWNLISRNFYFVMFCTALLCSAVWVSVSIENEVRQVYKLRTELNSIKTTYNYKNSLVSQKMRMTEIAKLVKPYGFVFSEQQPYRVPSQTTKPVPQYATIP